MVKLKVIGNYAPNLKGLPGSCYLIKGLKVTILLDFGNGNIKSVLKEIKKEEFENLLIILSHNHIDHSFDVLKLIPILKNMKIKVKIYLPKRSLMYYCIKNCKSVFEVYIINEKTKIDIDGAIIDFCQTFHSGESYATRIKLKNKVFVYTSDFSYVSKGLMYFCKEADIVLIDSGIPLENKFHLKGFHSNTKETLEDLFSFDCNVKKVLASHLKAYLKDKHYMKMFPEDKEVILVKKNLEYSIFN